MIFSSFKIDLCSHGAEIGHLTVYHLHWKLTEPTEVFTKSPQINMNSAQIRALPFSLVPIQQQHENSERVSYAKLFRLSNLLLQIGTSIT